MFFLDSLKNKPKNRVELHVHLDGAVRHETLWELLRQKQQPLPGNGSLSEFKAALKVTNPCDLAHFLQPFSIFAAAYAGDLKAIRRIAKEFVEDRAQDCVAYCEARFCPHLLMPAPPATVNGNANGHHAGDTITSDDVVEAVLNGIKEGEAASNGTKVTIILCCIRGKTEWSPDVLRLCEKYRDRGVVGIDLAGDEDHFHQTDRKALEEVYDPIEIEVFTAAKQKGIHRTVHAGETSAPHSIEKAILELHAERIGHGYRIVVSDQEHLPDICLEKGIHFEVCPYSSFLTGAMRCLDTDHANPRKEHRCIQREHPLVFFTEKGISCSINTDDPSLTLTGLGHEYDLIRSWGFNECHITKMNFEAAKHSFLPYEEKLELICHLKKVYGVDELTISNPEGAKSPNVALQRPAVTVAAWEDRS